MAISFEAIGERLATFAAGSGLTAGKVCKISANGTVGPCSEEGFCGVVSEVRGGAAGVILDGYVELSYAGATAPSATRCSRPTRMGTSFRRRRTARAERASSSAWMRQTRRSVFFYKRKGEGQWDLIM